MDPPSNFDVGRSQFPHFYTSLSLLAGLFISRLLGCNRRWLATKSIIVLFLQEKKIKPFLGFHWEATLETIY
ncbi:hypothetical protein EPI10_027307 [Gossypium australe]|uniref:Uncharacterized protein n=1 Tax=Gossypium australe TaxID=47621 RepID=A0A5B6UW06_9ROSI|nr:hypothetical protein EPI10_027307 [Gossypium australe]